MVAGERLKLIGRILIGLVVSAHIAGPSGAATLELKKKAGSYDVELRIDRNPPVVGDNGLELRITDPAGAVLKDAKHPLNADEILARIVERDLYSFGAKRPIEMVRGTLRKHLRGESGGRRVVEKSRGMYAVAG